MFKTAAAFDIYRGLIDQPKMRRIRGVHAPKFVEMTFVEQYRSEHDHFNVKGPRLHGVTAAAKDRHPKRSFGVERKPVAVRASQRVEIAQRDLPSQLPTADRSREL